MRSRSRRSSWPIECIGWSEMPIEIRELVIRARVEAPPPTATTPQAPQRGAEDLREIVAECVEQVLEILRQRDER